MKYYKCINGMDWCNFITNKIYADTYKTDKGNILKEILKWGEEWSKDFEEVSYADYLKQEYDAGRIDRGCLNYEVDRGKILVWEYLKIINNNKTNNMEELKLEKNKVIETYNNGCSKVKKTLERLFGKEIFENKYLDLSKIRTKFEDSDFLLDKDGNYLLTDAGSGPYPKKSLCLNNSYNWELIYTDNKYYLLPTKKLK